MYCIKTSNSEKKKKKKEIQWGQDLSAKEAESCSNDRDRSR